MKEALHEIWMAETRDNAYKAFDSAVKRFGDKYPGAINCLTKDKEQMLAFMIIQPLIGNILEQATR